MRNQKKGGKLNLFIDILIYHFGEEEMKSWTKPEIKMYGIRMDENIATSTGNTGDTDNGNKPVYSREYIYDGGLLGALYYCASDGNIQDTGIYYQQHWLFGKYVDPKDAGTISICRI